REKGVNPCQTLSQWPRPLARLMLWNGLLRRNRAKHESQPRGRTMKTIKSLITRTGYLLLAVIGAALAGCTTYVEQPRAEAPPPAYLPPPPPPTVVEVDIRTESDFYEPLRPYGRWEVVGPYGRCW